MNGFFYDSYRLVLSFLLLGIFLGGVFDMFRIFRIGRNETIDVSGRIYDLIRPRGSLFSGGRSIAAAKLRSATDRSLIYIEDILFFLIVAVAEILWFFHTNDGEIRIICLLFSVFGFLLYYSTVGRLVLLFAKRIVFILRCVIYWALYAVITPLRFCLRVLWHTACKLFRVTVGRAIEVSSRKRRTAYSEQKKKKLLQMASIGFSVVRESEV